MFLYSTQKTLELKQGGLSHSEHTDISLKTSTCEIYLGGLSENIHNDFDRQPWRNLFHSLYTPPVCLQDQYNVEQLVRQDFILPQKPQLEADNSYLIVVAFGKEQGTKLAVECCLVGLMAMFG